MIKRKIYSYGQSLASADTLECEWCDITDLIVHLKHLAQEMENDGYPFTAVETDYHSCQYPCVKIYGWRWETNEEYYLRIEAEQNKEEEDRLKLIERLKARIAKLEGVNNE
jgi:hypothetical protein